MADIFSKSKRSEVMSKIRARDTKAERIVFSYLRRRKIYFQRHYKRAPGSPDIALPRKKRAVFVDGDFWHGRLIHKIEGKEYWHAKILANMERDKRVNGELSEKGWQYMRVWESDLVRKSTAQTHLQSIADFLTI